MRYHVGDLIWWDDEDQVRWFVLSVDPDFITVLVLPHGHSHVRDSVWPEINTKMLEEYRNVEHIEHLHGPDDSL